VSNAAGAVRAAQLTGERYGMGVVMDGGGHGEGGGGEEEKGEEEEGEGDGEEKKRMLRELDLRLEYHRG
jgi:hypothetical protein